jgi:hypothetical protein
MLNYRKDIPLWTNFITALFSFNIGWFFGSRYSLKRKNSYDESIDKSIDDLEKGLGNDQEHNKSIDDLENGLGNDQEHEHDKYTFMTVGECLRKNGIGGK